MKQIKYNQFKLGKKKQYRGYMFSIGRLKFELIKCGKKRLYRIEWNDWND